MDTDWILTKNAIIQKVYDLFGEASIAYRAAIDQYPLFEKELVLTRSPKISKGEQYESLPWVMLDYPRYYHAGDSFGIRTFFWWGNGFSITIQLSGIFLKHYAGIIQQYLDNNALSENWLIGVGNDPWQHHFREDNYQPYTKREGLLLEELSFIKLTKRFPLSQWDDILVLLKKNFIEIGKMLLARENNQALPKR